MNKLIKNIEQWAEDRNLIVGSTPQKQFIKLMEEFGELCSGVSKNKVDVVKDSIGDCFVVMTILAKQKNYNDWRENGAKWGAVHTKDIFFTKSGKIKKKFGENPVESWLMSIAISLGELGKPIYFDDYKMSEGIWYDIFSGLQDLCFLLDLNFIDCIQSAWEKIKDRKGKMIDGVFVKEKDIAGK